LQQQTLLGEFVRRLCDSAHVASVGLVPLL
jgi:hypothetical protein